MAWTLKTYSGQTFHLTEDQKDFYLRKVEDGAKMVVFQGFVLSSNFEYLISDEHEALEKLKNNPVLNDPDFARYLQTHSPALAEILDRRYSTPKGHEAWEEAMKNKQYTTALQKT
jgi:hypothetical protein